jgi:hypothetical protein
MYPKQMNKFVIAMKEDMNPDNVLQGISQLDAEMQRLEAKYPDSFTNDDRAEIDEIIEGNKDLRGKVNEISNLVKMTLIKINVTTIINNCRILS